MRKKSALADCRAGWRLLAGLSVMIAMLCWAGTGRAQGAVVIGGGGKPEVEVNLGALDQLGTEPNYGSRLTLPPGPRANGPIQLHPPGTKKAHATRRSANGSAVHLRPPGSKPAAKPRRTAKAAPAKRAPAKMPKAPPKAVAVEKPAPPPAPPPAAAKPEAPPAPEAPAKSAALAPVPPPPPAPAPPAPPQAASNEMAAKPQSPGISAGGALGPIGSAPPPPPPAAVEKPPQRDVAVVPALPSAPAKQAASEASKVAALPPTSSQPAAAAGDDLVVRFQRGDANLSRDAEQQLAALAGELSHNDARLQLKAYAGSASDPSSGARRMSLSRALAVRSYLIDKGVRSTRIDVRALGAANDSGPPDRVDVMVQGQ